MWTLPYRYEIKLSEGWKDLTIYQGLTLQERFEFTKPVDHWHEEKMNIEYKNDISSGLNALSKSFYKCVDEDFFNSETLKNIFLLQSFLKNKNINYTFAASTTAVLNLIKSNDPLAKMVDTTYWLNLDIGFVEWSKSNKFNTYIMGHPVEQAHAAWLNYYIK
jgi:hypothetical protein